MSIAALKNTMTYQLRGRPLSIPRNMDLVPVDALANAIDAFMLGEIPPESSAGKYTALNSMSPESHALWFYLGNHAMRELAAAFAPNEELPAAALEICEEYHSRAAYSAARAFYYLAVITAREARHCKNKGSLSAEISKEFGQTCVDALLSYVDANAIGNTTGVFRNKLTGTSVVNFAKSVQYTHYNGSYANGYGGPAWGSVADCLVAFVTGESTAEMMLDTVWTLSHNNGPIFNKGMLYHGYDSGVLLAILDVQRAGQIPALVNTSQKTGVYTHVTAEMREFSKKVLAVVPGSKDFQAIEVDWERVEQLGAVGNYGHYKNSVTSKKAPLYSAASHYKKPWAHVAKPAEPTPAVFHLTPKKALPLAERSKKKVVV